MLLFDRADLIETARVCDGSADAASMFSSCSPFSAASC